MLFNETEDAQVDIRPVKTDPALLQRCEYVSVIQPNWYMSINQTSPQILEKRCCLYSSMNAKCSVNLQRVVLCRPLLEIPSNDESWPLGWTVND